MKRWTCGRRSVCRVVPGILALLCIAWPLAEAGVPGAPFVRAGVAAQETTPVVPAQPSLVEIARLEELRRKTLKGPSKVFTDKDVRRALPSPGTNPESPPSSTPVPDAPAPAGGQPEQAGKGEEWWKNRMNQAREELRRNEAFVEALQTRVNALTSDFVGRDDPYQRAKIGEDRQKALAELDRVKNEIERGKQAILDIEEEARKAGVPPGWVR